MKVLLLIASIVIFSGCKLKVDTQLVVSNGKSLTLIDEKRNNVLVGQGSYRAILYIDQDLKKPAEMKLYINKTKKIIKFQLPNRADLFYSNEPLYVDAELSGQNLQIVITRQPDIKDLFTIFFINAEADSMLAKLQFNYESKHVSVDPEQNSFLESYQKVVKKHRGVMMLIDADMDVEGDKASQAWDGLLNYSSKFYISPWLHTRYKEVKWALGNLAEDNTYKDQQWTDLFKTVAVIDYFSYVHNDRQWQSSIMSNPHKKPNQLRLVYSSGCGAESSSEWISEYGAIAGVGHFDISASPFFQVSLTRNWVYGMDLKKAVVRSWKSGLRKIHALEWASFARFWQEDKGFIDWDSVEEMISSSELMVSHIAEIPIEKLAIDQSAVATGDYLDAEVVPFADYQQVNFEGSVIIEHKVTELMK